MASMPWSMDLASPIVLPEKLAAHSLLHDILSGLAALAAHSSLCQSILDAMTRSLAGVSADDYRMTRFVVVNLLTHRLTLSKG